MDKYLKMLNSLGTESAKIIDPASVVTAPWTIYKCQFGCSRYGTNRLCPPKSLDYKQTQEIINCFKSAILFCCAGKLIVTDIAVKVAREIFFDGYYKVVAFGGGPCEKCRECNEKKCNFPNDVAPAMEACGIDVFQTVRNNGYAINTLRCEEEAPKYFGLILVE